MKTSKSGLFLMELIISILFFSLAGAACLQLFVKAHLLDRETTAQSQMVIWSENLAALWHSSGSDLSAVSAQLDADYENISVSSSLENDSLVLYFDERFLLTGADNSYYYLILENLGYDAETMLSGAELTFYQKSTAEDVVLYSLPLQFHPKLKGGSSHAQSE